MNPPDFHQKIERALKDAQRCMESAGVAWRTAVRSVACLHRLCGQITQTIGGVDRHSDTSLESSEDYGDQDFEARVMELHQLIATLQYEATEDKRISLINQIIHINLEQLEVAAGSATQSIDPGNRRASQAHKQIKSLLHMLQIAHSVLSELAEQLLSGSNGVNIKQPGREGTQDNSQTGLEDTDQSMDLVVARKDAEIADLKSQLSAGDESTKPNTRAVPNPVSSFIAQGLVTKEAFQQALRPETFQRSPSLSIRPKQEMIAPDENEQRRMTRESFLRTMKNLEGNPHDNLTNGSGHCVSPYHSTMANISPQAQARGLPKMRLNPRSPPFSPSENYAAASLVKRDRLREKRPPTLPSINPDSGNIFRGAAAIKPRPIRNAAEVFGHSSYTKEGGIVIPSTASRAWDNAFDHATAREWDNAFNNGTTRASICTSNASEDEKHSGKAPNIVEEGTSAHSVTATEATHLAPHLHTPTLQGSKGETADTSATNMLKGSKEDAKVPSFAAAVKMISTAAPTSSNALSTVKPSNPVPPHLRLANPIRSGEATAGSQATDCLATLSTYKSNPNTSFAGLATAQVASSDTFAEQQLAIRLKAPSTPFKDIENATSISNIPASAGQASQSFLRPKDLIELTSNAKTSKKDVIDTANDSAAFLSAASTAYYSFKRKNYEPKAKSESFEDEPIIKNLGTKVTSASAGLTNMTNKPRLELEGTMMENIKPSIYTKAFYRMPKGMNPNGDEIVERYVIRYNSRSFWYELLLDWRLVRKNSRSFFVL